MLRLPNVDLTDASQADAAVRKAADRFGPLDGLLHISQISHERIASVADHLKEGQVVKVKVLEADDKGRVRLSMKAVKEQETAKQNA